MADSLKIFPTRYKFSGSTKDGSMTIVEFLSSVKIAQRQCRLSEQEFLDTLLACTTGRAHLLLTEWINNKLSMSSIFHNFTLHFDRRLTSEEARAQLSVYKAPKNASLHEVLAHLMMLGARISAAMPDDVSRKATYDLEIINALIRCLPPHSATQVQNVKCSLSARLGRLCEATELSRALNMYRSSIDADIRANGSDPHRSRNPKDIGKRNRNSNWSQYTNTSYLITNTPRQQNNTSIGRARVKLPPTRGPYVVQRHTSVQRPSINLRSTGNIAANRGTRGKFNNKSNTRRPTNKPRGPNVSTGCSLCGYSNHTASQGCRNMRTDDGKIYKTHPVYGTCSLCPGSKKNTLHHPPALCPFRKGGPLHNRN
jgi:hypothetical protein